METGGLEATRPVPEKSDGALRGRTPTAPRSRAWHGSGPRRRPGHVGGAVARNARRVDTG